MTVDETEGKSPTRRSWTRRAVLGLLATGGGAVLSDAVDTDGASAGGAGVALGDDAGSRVRESWKYDGWYLGPSTAAPATTEPVTWLYHDDLGVTEPIIPDSLPASWTVSGLEWGAATSLAAARDQAGVPGVAIVDDGTGFVFEMQLPDQDTQFVAAGLQLVMASDLAGAESLRSQAPALLVGADGTAEVVV